MSKFKITVNCGESVKDTVSTVGHPKSDKAKAYELVTTISEDTIITTNSAVLIVTLVNLAETFGIDINIVLDGKSCGKDTRPVMIDLGLIVEVVENDFITTTK